MDLSVSSHAVQRYRERVIQDEYRISRTDREIEYIIIMAVKRNSRRLKALSELIGKGYVKVAEIDLEFRGREGEFLATQEAVLERHSSVPDSAVVKTVL